MKSLSIAIVLSALLSTSTSLAIAQNSIADTVLKGQPITLFDGKSTDGWETANGEKSKNWVVTEDGTLFRKTRGGDLYHKHWYRDFDLRFEWKIKAKGNSGVKYRVKQYGKRRLGCEYQVQDDKQNLFGKHSTGALYAVYEPGKNKTLKPLGEWNSSRIVVSGYNVEHWLNGEKVMTATFGSADWYNRIAQSKFNKYENFGLNREGRIFLQDHGNPTWFRNIVVTPLNSSQPALAK